MWIVRRCLWKASYNSIGYHYYCRLSDPYNLPHEEHLQTMLCGVVRQQMSRLKTNTPLWKRGFLLLRNLNCTCIVVQFTVLKQVGNIYKIRLLYLSLSLLLYWTRGYHLLIHTKSGQRDDTERCMSGKKRIITRGPAFLLVIYIKPKLRNQHISVVHLPLGKKKKLVPSNFIHNHSVVNVQCYTLSVPPVELD